MAMLEVKDLHVFYGVIEAIKGISFSVEAGEVVALIGDGAVTGGMNPAFARHFDAHEETAAALKRLAKPGDVFLFKGSRGMHMERILEMFLKDEK